MNTRAVAVAALVAVLALGLVACGAELDETPDSVATPDTGSPSPAAPESVDATCETIATDDFRSMMAENEWVSWTDDERPGRPFDAFPSGAPADALTCVWGAAPELATDNVVVLAWAPIDADAAAAAQESLEAEGFERIEAPEGIYLAMPADPQDPQASEDGYVQSYLFAEDDVRWAMYKDELEFITAPSQSS